MNKEIFAVIDGKEYTKKGYMKFIGELIMLDRVKRLRFIGYSASKIAEILEISESSARKFIKKVDES